MWGCDADRCDDRRDGHSGREARPAREPVEIERPCADVMHVQTSRISTESSASGHEDGVWDWSAPGIAQSASATSPTTSPGPYSRPAASDPNDTVDREENSSCWCSTPPCSLRASWNSTPNRTNVSCRRRRHTRSTRRSSCSVIAVNHRCESSRPHTTCRRYSPQQIDPSSKLTKEPGADQMHPSAAARRAMAS
jgi:hypothetical protein